MTRVAREVDAGRSAGDADLRRFAADEKRCCTFWGFAIDTHDDELIICPRPDLTAPCPFVCTYRSWWRTK